MFLRLSGRSLACRSYSIEFVTKSHSLRPTKHDETRTKLKRLNNRFQAHTAA